MPITSKSVYSSFVDSLVYDSDQGTMTVVYQNGNQSTHSVTPEQADNIWNAPSVGRALHQHIEGFSTKGKPRVKSG